MKRWYRMFKNIMVFLAVTVCLSCKEFVEIDPPTTQIATTTVFRDDATAVSAIRGIYSSMISNSNFASGSLSSLTMLCGLSADELINYSSSTDYDNFYTNSLLATNTFIKTGIWLEAYKFIYYSNSLLEGIASSAKLSNAIKNQLQGEALFIRAFCHFYLTNLFGEVPIILSTDYRLNSKAKSESINAVYSQIVSDLKLAKTLLADDYSFSDNERTRPNKWAAITLLARTYLYQKDWKNAESESSFVIGSGKFSLVTDLNSVFLKNSSEAIWQLIGTSAVRNTFEGALFILTEKPNSLNGLSLSPELSKSFEKGDMRKTNWVDSITVASIKYYFPKKYKLKTSTSSLQEYSMVIRYAELFLIRAEARIMQGKISDGIEDLNTLRTRARAIETLQMPDLLPNLPTTLSISAALLAIENERQSELFTEWGHRWLDLKRTERIDQVLGLKKPNWQSKDAHYPVPESEILANPNIKQNQ